VSVTTGYRVLFYAFPVPTASITADTRWSLTTMTALFCASQVIPVGRWVQARGPRPAMTAALVAGPAVAAIALARTRGSSPLPE